jgi:hypothetical protein
MVAPKGNFHRKFPSIHVAKDGLGVAKVSTGNKASGGPIVVVGIA